MNEEDFGVGRTITTQPARDPNRDTYQRVAPKLPAFEQLEQFSVREYFPQITKEDIDNEVISRYFTRPVNQKSGDIIEISKQTYDRIRFNTFYKTIEMRWRIAGKIDDVPGPPNKNTPTRLFTGAKTANELALELADKELPGMKNKILNLLQFYKGRG